MLSVFAIGVPMIEQRNLPGIVFSALIAIFGVLLCTAGHGLRWRRRSSAIRTLIVSSLLLVLTYLTGTGLYITFIFGLPAIGVILVNWSELEP